MHRRALLAGLGALSAGCLSAPATDTEGDTTRTNDPATPPKRCDPETDTATTTPTAGTESNAEFVISTLSASSEVDGPSAKYLLEPSKFYSRSAVQREADQTGDELVVRDISEISSPEVRTAIKTAV